MHNTILASLLALAVFVFYKIVSTVAVSRQNAARARELGCKEPPTIKNLGWFGTAHLNRALAANDNFLFPAFLIERQEELSREVGYECATMKGHLFGKPIYFTSDPKNIQAMLATQFQDFDLGPVRAKIMGEVLGDGIFVQDGAAWKHSRDMLRPNFVRDQISDLDMEERHVEHLMAELPADPTTGWTDLTDIQTLFFRLTIDAATEFLFGESVNSQVSEGRHSAFANSGSNARNEQAFSKNFDGAQRHMTSKFRLGDYHWWYNPKEYKVNNKIVNDFARTYVDAALENASVYDDKKMEEGLGEKEKYVFLQELVKKTRDPDELRAQMLNILLAGRDTTASLLSWFMHEMLRNPDVFDKLRQVIVDEFGTHENPRDITFASLKGCQYLQHCINETLRLWSVVPVNARRTNKATTIPRGGGPDGNSPVFLPADTPVDYSIHVMHRRKDLWGEDANEFRPERFAGRKVGWEFLPFNGGPRICIGQQFALTETSYVLVRLLQKFDKIEAAPGELGQRPTSRLTLTSCPGRPVTLRLHEAKA